MIKEVDFCNSKTGFRIEDKKAIFQWWMYQAFEKGVSPSEFRKSQMRDIKSVMMLKNAVETKQIREVEIERAIAEMKAMG